MSFQTISEGYIVGLYYAQVHGIYLPYIIMYKKYAVKYNWQLSIIELDLQ